ncbi:MAG TPA: iron uptake system protein EfeO [Streptosporangiaceae bacterium]|nr:iron uptake system protein EfeO [Streptosporangiaceae bacterium]
MHGRRQEPPEMTPGPAGHGPVPARPVPATPRPARRAGGAGITALAAVVALGVVAGCGSSAGGAGSAPGSGSDSRTTTVSIDITRQGCEPRPAKISAGQVQFNVTNKNADAVSEAELRTGDLAKILGEQENLTPGLSGGFALTIQPGSYKITCPGAAQPHSTLTVSGQASGASWQSSPQLSAAVHGYSSYISDNTASLVARTQQFCTAINAGSMERARVAYPQARVYYEHIEPVAEIWGDLDTQIDGRWENPVTVRSQFTGFHRLEQLLWEDNTLAGAPRLCSDLVRHEQQLLKLVRSAQYNPLEMASGATELINEAGTSKISGEEERYSSTDLPVFQANVDGAMEIVSLLKPYLEQKNASLLSLIQRRDDAIARQMKQFQASPGYDDTGYVEYSTVLDSQRRKLSAAVNALAEALSKISLQVS